MSKNLVPQWSTPIATAAAMPKGPPPHCKLRTGVQKHPSSSKQIRNTLGNGGTWSTPKNTKKNPLKVSGVLKEDQFPFLAMVDSMITGTGLTSDLNTPDIKFEDFDFKGKAINSYNVSNMEVDGSLAALEPVSVACSSDEDSSSKDVATNGHCYSLFDMSPGTRDILQVDQQEQRVNIQEYVQGGGDNNGVAIPRYLFSNIAMSDPGFELLNPLPNDSTTATTYVGNGLGTNALGQPPIMMMELPNPYDSPPQLSITDDDLNFTLPQEVLDQMESLFPEEKPVVENPPPANNGLSTELDMYLGTQGLDDLLSRSLHDSGLCLDEELETFDIEEDSNISDQAVLSGYDAGPFILPSNMVFSEEPSVIVQPVHDQQAMCVTPTPSTSTTGDFESFTLTPTVSTEAIAFATKTLHATPKTLYVTPTSSKTIGTCPRAPSKKRQHHEVETPTIIGERQKRVTKKPLRFREADTLVDLVDFELNENALRSAAAASRLGGIEENGNSSHGVEVEIKEEEEYDDDTTSNSGGRRARTSVQNLTEEEKYHRIRVLNNEASKRCRQKRKSTVKDMSKELVVLQEKNDELKKKHQTLEQLRDKFQVFVHDYFRKRLAKSQ